MVVCDPINFTASPLLLLLILFRLSLSAGGCIPQAPLCYLYFPAQFSVFFCVLEYIFQQNPSVGQIETPSTLVYNKVGLASSLKSLHSPFPNEPTFFRSFEMCFPQLRSFSLRTFSSHCLCFPQLRSSGRQEISYNKNFMASGHKDWTFHITLFVLSTQLIKTEEMSLPNFVHLFSHVQLLCRLDGAIVEIGRSHNQALLPQCCAIASLSRFCPQPP